MEHQGGYTIIDYLHGKVADYTVSRNVIESVLAERGCEACTPFGEVDETVRHLCYADLLKYVYLQPGLTKSYSQTNGTWSHKEGATQLSADDKKLIYNEMCKQYALGEEVESIPAPVQGIRMNAYGMKVTRNYPKRLF